MNTKYVGVGSYQCDGRMDGYRCLPSSMTLQIVSMFEYGYDVYIVADDAERRGRRTRRRSVTLPMYAIIFCQNPAAALGGHSLMTSASAMRGWGLDQKQT